jgi:hypothetical protein
LFNNYSIGLARWLQLRGSRENGDSEEGEHRHMMTDKVMDASMIDGYPRKRTGRRRLRKHKWRVQREMADLPGALTQEEVLEEVLVVDDRAHLRPAEVVEHKLARMLQEASVAVSHLQMRGLLKAR